MQTEWKLTITADGGRALFGAFKVANIEEAGMKAMNAVAIIKSHRDDTFSHMALSHDSLVIMLHGVAKNQINEADWGVANEIRVALNDDAC